MKTYECKPTLNDSQVLEFCKDGFMLLEGVVPDEINQRTLEFLDARPADAPGEPTEILEEAWFVDNVILQPDAIGAVRSLLGNQVAMPILMSSHRVQCPGPAQEWHNDSGSVFGPELDYLQVFYYPQDCPRDLGPTEVLPGSHFLFADQGNMGHYGRIRGSVHTVAPAGSIFIAVYSIWHRRSESWGTGLRNLLKYNYWRTEGPKCDWIVDPNFDFETADYRVNGTRFRPHMMDTQDTAEMFFWLRGQTDGLELKGGQGWPMTEANFNQAPYGIPEELKKS